MRVVWLGVLADAGVGLVDWSVGIERVGCDEILLLSIAKFSNIVAEVGTEGKGSSVDELINVSVVVAIEGTAVTVVRSGNIAKSTVAEVTIGSEVVIREVVIRVSIGVVRLVGGAIRVSVTITVISTAVSIGSIRVAGELGIIRVGVDVVTGGIADISSVSVTMVAII